MNKLNVKAIINCATCGCLMKRTKSIKVSANEKKEAIKEANKKVTLWKESLNGQNCRVCKSIIKDLSA